MTELENTNTYPQNEAALTKKSGARTLKSKTNPHMEEDQEDIEKVTKKIKNIVRDRQRRGVNADQAAASRSVWETMLGRKLSKQEVKSTVERGAPLSSEAEPTKEELGVVEKIIKNSKKYEELISSTKSYTPEQLRQTFSGDLGKIVTVILSEGVVGEDKYIHDLNEAIAKKGPQMHQEVADIVKKIEHDVNERKRQEVVEEEARMKPEGVDFRKEKARQALEKHIEEKRRRGEPITPEYLKLANERIERGVPPIGGGAEDGSFSTFDWEKYQNEELRVLGLELKMAGEVNQVDQNVIKDKLDRLVRLRAGSKISDAELNQFRVDLGKSILAWQKEREKGLEVSTEINGQQTKDQSFQNAKEKLSTVLSGIGGNEEGADFEQKKRLVLEGDMIDVLLTNKIADPERLADMKREWLSLQGVKNPAEFKEKVGGFIENVSSTESAKEEDTPPANLEEARVKGKKKGVEINSIYQRGIDQGWLDPDLLRTEPRNIVDLAKWIMITDDARIWGPEGDHPLFEIRKTGDVDDNGKEIQEIEFRSDSFIMWLRNKMIELHLDNSTDPMSPLTLVAIRTLYSPVNLISMKYDKQRYFSDPKTGEIMDDLYNEVILEAWLFGVRRNNDLIYRQAMNSDDKLFETIVGINAKNEHTNSKNAAEYYSMADKYVRGYDENGKERLRDTKVGDAILLANAIYRNISDMEKLKKLLPQDSPLFTREGWEDAVRVIQGIGRWDKVTEYANMRFEEKRVFVIDSSTKQELVIFDENGKINGVNFIKHLNFFLSPTALQTNVSHVRELVKLSIAKEIGLEDGLSYPPDKQTWEKEEKEAKDNKRSISIARTRNIKRINLEFAEINSFVEQRWNGAAARSDTGVRGYDAWAKMSVQRYRERQSGVDTMGPIGNPYDIPILKQLAPDMWLALKTENGEVVQEVFEKIISIIPKLYKEAKTDEERAQVQKLRNKFVSSLSFPEGTQLDWASNQVMRGAKVWHAMLDTEDLGFSKLVTRNVWGVLQYSRPDFEKTVKDTFIKNRRYAFKSNNALNYGAKERVMLGFYQNNDKDKKFYSEDKELVGTPFYKEMTVAEYMFGHDVTAPLIEDWYDGKAKIKKKLNPRTGKIEEDVTYKGAQLEDYLSSAEGRNHLFKNACRAGLAAQLKAHRNWQGTGERWNNSMVRNFVDSLKTLRAYKEEPPGSGNEVIDTSQGGFFSQEDIDWILAQAGCQKWKMALQDAGVTGLDLSKSIPELLKTFMSGIVDFS